MNESSNWTGLSCIKLMEYIHSTDTRAFNIYLRKEIKEKKNHNNIHREERRERGKKHIQEISSSSLLYSLTYVKNRSKTKQ